MSSGPRRRAKVCDGGACVHSQGGAEGGAKVRFCEGILRCTQPNGYSLMSVVSVSRVLVVRLVVRREI